MIEFIAPYTFTPFWTTGNTELPLFYTLSFHRFSLHWSYPGNWFVILSLSLQITREPSCHSRILAISSESPSTAISRTRLNSLPTTVLYSPSDTLCPFTTPRHGPHVKRRLLLLTLHACWSVTLQWISYCRLRMCCGDVLLARCLTMGMNVIVYSCMNIIQRPYEVSRRKFCWINRRSHPILPECISLVCTLWLGGQCANYWQWSSDSNLGSCLFTCLK
jgi:hypothetical protein